LERAEMRDQLSADRFTVPPAVSFPTPAAVSLPASCLLGIIYFLMPILTPHPDPASTPDIATQAAIESMANLLFILETVRLLS
jgi:hypothetical protein